MDARPGRPQRSILFCYTLFPSCVAKLLQLVGSHSCCFLGWRRSARKRSHRKALTQARRGTGQGVARVGGGVSAPRVIYAPDPEYSEKARKAGYRGTCVLWLVVDTKGMPQEHSDQRMKELAEKMTPEQLVEARKRVESA